MVIIFYGGISQSTLLKWKKKSGQTKNENYM